MTAYKSIQHSYKGATPIYWRYARPEKAATPDSTKALRQTLQRRYARLDKGATPDSSKALRQTLQRRYARRIEKALRQTQHWRYAMVLKTAQK